jgi:hypothetical protein
MTLWTSFKDFRLFYSIEVSLIKVYDTVNLFQRLQTVLQYRSFFDQSVWHCEPLSKTSDCFTVTKFLWSKCLTLWTSFKDFRLFYSIEVSFIKVYDTVNLSQRLKTVLQYRSFFDQSVWHCEPLSKTSDCFTVSKFLWSKCLTLWTSLKDFRLFYSIEVSLIKVSDTVNLSQRLQTVLQYRSFIHQSVWHCEPLSKTSDCFTVTKFLWSKCLTL